MTEHGAVAAAGTPQTRWRGDTYRFWPRRGPRRARGVADDDGTTGPVDASREKRAGDQSDSKLPWRAAASRSPWRLSPAATPRVRWLFPRKASDGVFGATRRRGSGARGGAPRGRRRSGASCPASSAADSPPRRRNQPSSTRSSRRNATRVLAGSSRSVRKRAAVFGTEIARAPIPRRNANRTRSDKRKSKRRARRRRRARAPGGGHPRGAQRVRFVRRSHRGAEHETRKRDGYATDSEHDPPRRDPGVRGGLGGHVLLRLGAVGARGRRRPRVRAWRRGAPLALGSRPRWRARRRRAATPARSPPGLPGSA